MFLLYLDDSGSVKNAGEDYLVLGGVSIPENSIRWLTNQLEELAQRVWPQDPRAIEFHASETYSGKGPVWSTFQKPQRVQIIKDVLGTLGQAHAEVKCFACAVHKASFQAEDPVLMAFEDVSGRFDLYLRSISTEQVVQRGIIVVDDTSYENSLQALITRFREEGNRWGNQLRSLCEVPLFVDSSASRIIQLADHVAYAVFRRYNANDLNYFNSIEGRFHQAGGVIHGLCHRQTITKSCTCPACITRRIGAG